MFALRPRPPPVRKDKSSARSVSGTRYPHGIDDTIPITKKETHLTSDGEIIGDLHLHNASFSTYNDRDFSYTPSNVYFRSPSPSDFSCPLRKAMLLSGVLEEIPSMSDELLNAPHSNLSFTRRPVPDISREPPESALTNLLNSPSPPVINPFSCLTGPLPSGEDLINIRVYFPHAESPKGKFLEFKVEKEAEVDRLIVLALWTYWEMAWFPPLPVNHIDDSNSPRVSTLSKFLNAKLHRATSLWTLRIVKDDFLDYATEAPDASDKVKVLDSEEYALVPRESAGPFGDVGGSLSSTKPAQSRSSKGSRTPRRYSNPGPSSIKKRLSHVRELSLPFRRGSIASENLDYSYDARRMRCFAIALRSKSGDQTRPMDILIPLNSTVEDLLQSACRAMGVKHPEKYTLTALDVRNCYQAIPLEWNVSKFKTNTQFVLVKC